MKYLRETFLTILIVFLLTPTLLFAAPHEPSPAGGNWLELNPKLGQVQTDAPWFPELTGMLTIEAWIYVDEPLSKQVVFSLVGQTDRFNCLLMGTPMDEDEDGILDTQPGILSQGITEHSGTMRGRLPMRQWVHYVATINRGAAVGSDGYIAEGVGGSELPVPNTNHLVLGGIPVISGIPMMPGFKARFASGVYIDELRISSVVRYKGTYGVPTQAFTADADTIGLYHFDAESDQPYEDSSGSQIPLIRSDTTLFPDFASLFHNFDAAVHESTPVVRIRSKPATYNLSLELLDAPEDPDAAPTLLPESRPQNLGVRVGQRKQLVRAGPMAYYGPSRRYHGPARPSRRPNAWPPPIHFESLGPGLLRNQDVARLWDGVVLTEAEDIVLETPRLVVGKRLERLTVVGGPESGGSGRRVVAKLSARSAPVPLKRLGDGANRLLAIALALANCRGGILLMDEVENGIHYSVQSDLWRMIFRAAQSANVQVIAATHSWDCVVGFARAADESPADGWLYRLEREEDELAAVGYSETNLIVAARQRTEVR